MGADECTARSIFRENSTGPREHIVRGVALEVEVNEVEPGRGEKLVAVGIVGGDVLVGSVVRVGTAIPWESSEALGGEEPLEERGVAVVLHVVITDDEAVGHDTVQAVETLARQLPLLCVVDVHNVADVTHENDVLGADIFRDPAGVVLENRIDQRSGALGRALRGATAVALGVGDDDDGEGTGRRRIECGAAERNAEGEHGGDQGAGERQAKVIHRSSVTPKFTEKS